MYSETSFIRNLDYLVMVKSYIYTSTHVQRVWPMTIWGCGDSTFTGLPWQKLTDLHTCMNAVDSDYSIQISFKDKAP